jgi:hypothetical protein
MITSHNNFSLKWWAMRYRNLYKRICKYKRSINLTYVKFNHKLLLTFFSFVNKIFKTFDPSFDETIYSRRIIRKFLRFYVFFFLKKNVLNVYGKLIELISTYLGFKMKSKIFILDNKSVPASFIAKFIATGLRLRYDYLDMIIPIKRNLRKLMYIKKWRQDLLVGKKILLNNVINSSTYTNKVYNLFFFSRSKMKSILKKINKFNIFYFSNKNLKTYLLISVRDFMIRFSKYSNGIDGLIQSLAYNVISYDEFNRRHLLRRIKYDYLKEYYAKYNVIYYIPLKKKIFRIFKLIKTFRNFSRLNYENIRNLKNKAYAHFNKSYALVKKIFKKKRFFLDWKSVYKKHFLLNFKKIFSFYFFKLFLYRFKFKIAKKFVYNTYKFFFSVNMKKNYFNKYLFLKNIYVNCKFLLFMKLKKYHKKVKNYCLKFYLNNYVKDFWQKRIYVKRYINRYYYSNFMPKKLKINYIKIHRKILKNKFSKYYFLKKEKKIKENKLKFLKTFNVKYNKKWIKKESYLNEQFERAKRSLLYLIRKKYLIMNNKYVKNFKFLIYYIMDLGMKRQHNSYFYSTYPFLEKTDKQKRFINIKALKLYEIIKKFQLIKRNVFKKNILKNFKIKDFFSVLRRKKSFINKGFKVISVHLKRFFIFYNNYKYFLTRFIYNINNYKNYIKNINNRFNVIMKDNMEDKPILFKNKIDRLHYLDNNSSIMHGYKFHFVGRFTRKQMAANLWFTKGVLPYSSAKIKLDYSFYSVVLRYSVCTIKIWLYKAKFTPVYKYRII